MSSRLQDAGIQALTHQPPDQPLLVQPRNDILEPRSLAQEAVKVFPDELLAVLDLLPQHGGRREQSFELRLRPRERRPNLLGKRRDVATVQLTRSALSRWCHG